VKKLLLILLVFLSGCSFRIDGWEFEQANKICKDRGGVSLINVLLDDSVTCLDGYKESLKRTSSKIGA